MANNGSVARVTNTLDSARTQTFTYDHLNRVSTAAVPAAWGLSFGYDVWGNLLSQTVTQGSAPMLSVAVNANNRITNSGFLYDSAGNLTNDGSATYSYDLDNRLTTTAGVTYTYDGDGNRAEKDQTSGSTYDRLYWYGLAGEVLVETDLAGNNPDEYVFFNDQRVARRKSTGELNYYFTDHLGSTRVATTATGQLLDDSDYYPFGAERVVASASGNRYKFAGHERDTESGLDYYKYRMISSQLNRWTTTDPILASPLQAQSLNRYNYVVNNPTNLTDPTGMFHEPWPEDLPPPICEPFPFDPGDVVACVLGDIFCPGTTDCSYYDDRCRDPRVVQKRYYCRIAPNVCKDAGDLRVLNCIRLCLQANDDCWQIASTVKFTICIARLHEDCLAECFGNPSCYLPQCE